MKQIWVKISYYWFLFMLFIVGLLCGGLETKADSVNYNYSQYRVQYYQLSTGTSAWNSWTNFGTSSPLSSGYGVSTLAFRFGFTNKFQASNNYRVVIEVGYSPTSTIQETFILPDTPNIHCYGSSTSSWSSDSTLIDSCTYIGAIRVNNTNHVKYVFDVVPTLAVYGIQINIPFGGTSEVFSVRAHTSSEILTGNDIGGAIDNQTIIIQDEFQNITNIINQNNEDLIDAITEDNKVCKTITYNKNSEVGNNNVVLNASGVANTNNTSAFTTPYIKLGNETKIKQLNYTNYYVCFYDNDYTFISCIRSSSSLNNTYYTIPTNAKYVRYSLSKSFRYDFFAMESCSQGNQSINDTLTDSSVSDPSSSISDMEALLPSNGTITQLIALPLNLYQKVLNSINGTCSSFNLGSLYGTNLIMPCIDLSTYLGNSVWSTIDLIMSGVFVLVIARKMIKAFNSFTFMKEGDVIND